MTSESRPLRYVSPYSQSGLKKLNQPQRKNQNSNYDKPPSSQFHRNSFAGNQHRGIDDLNDRMVVMAQESAVSGF